TRIFTDHRKGDVGAISPFNFLQSTLYGRDAIATDEHGFSRIKTEGSDTGPHAKTRRREGKTSINALSQLRGIA
ncbi:MAG: hypothetical protein ACK5TX_16155, partial [Planctomyces sp.]